MKLVVEKGMRKMEIEYDSSVVIEQVKSNTSFCRLRAILVNIATIANRVEQITWMTIPRAANECVN